MRFLLLQLFDCFSTMEKDDKWMDLVKTILLCFVTMLLVNSLKECVLKVADRHANYKQYKNVGYETLLSQISEEERQSFVVYGFNEVKELYLLHDLLPNEKYFVIQEWHSKYSDFVKQDIRNTFQKSETKWILTSGSVENIADILEQRYEVVEKMDSFGLYHFKY